LGEELKILMIAAATVLKTLSCALVFVCIIVYICASIAAQLVNPRFVEVDHAHTSDICNDITRNAATRRLVWVVLVVFFGLGAGMSLGTKHPVRSLILLAM
jgi:hypothetical protein